MSQARGGIEKAQAYDIVVNERGEVLLAIDARDTEVDGPMLVLDGNAAVLVRREDDTLVLPDLPQGLKEKILRLDTILVAETDDKGVVREYVAPVMTG